MMGFYIRNKTNLEKKEWVGTLDFLILFNLIYWLSFYTAVNTIAIVVEKMSELSALLQLLTEACSTVEHEYAKTSRPLPSLDDLEPHPLDTEIYPTELRKAVRVIEAATAQMVALVGRPNHVIANVYNSFLLGSIPKSLLIQILEIRERKLLSRLQRYHVQL